MFVPGSVIDDVLISTLIGDFPAMFHYQSQRLPWFFHYLCALRVRTEVMLPSVHVKSLADGQRRCIYFQLQSPWNFNGNTSSMDGILTSPSVLFDQTWLGNPLLQWALRWKNHWTKWIIHHCHVRLVLGGVAYAIVCEHLHRFGLCYDWSFMDM